uniref:hypothetical protein n=1 Tax=Pseudomonas aeruginosa TaxID=287 RepID=UPI0015BDD850|nr:hypothetical protein [Pseudomonas aeruginosa]
MRKRRLVEIEETFCDVCGEKCGNHAIRTNGEGLEQHACLDYNKDYGKQCAAVLDERLLEAAISRRKQNERKPFPAGAVIEHDGVRGEVVSDTGGERFIKVIVGEQEAEWLICEGDVVSVISLPCHAAQTA